MTDFRGAHVLITGAARGLGRLLALEAARRGAKVTLLDLDAERLGEVCGEVQGAGGDSEGFVVDLSDRAAVAACCAEVRAHRGPVGILINNAGIVGGKTLLESSEASIERTFQVNALANFWTVRAFLPHMLEMGQGHIVTIASMAGLAGASRLVDYCASKFAAVGFDEALRLELKRLGSPVRTTLICPYYIDTGMFDGARTRFSWLLPILKPAYVARRVVEAIEGNRKRLLMPRFALALPVARVLPVTLFDGLMTLFGLNRSMDAFVGRPEPAQNPGRRP